MVKGEGSPMRSDRRDAGTSGAQLECTGTPFTRTSERGGSPLTRGPCSIIADRYMFRFRTL